MHGDRAMVVVGGGEVVVGKHNNQVKATMEAVRAWMDSGEARVR